MWHPDSAEAIGPRPAQRIDKGLTNLNRDVGGVAPGPQARQPLGEQHGHTDRSECPAPTRTRKRRVLTPVTATKGGTNVERPRGVPTLEGTDLPKGRRGAVRTHKIGPHSPASKSPRKQAASGAVFLGSSMGSSR
jgi:hypothetical protein